MYTAFRVVLKLHAHGKAVFVNGVKIFRACRKNCFGMFESDTDALKSFLLLPRFSILHTPAVLSDQPPFWERPEPFLARFGFGEPGSIQSGQLTSQEQQLLPYPTWSPLGNMDRAGNRESGGRPCCGGVFFLGGGTMVPIAKR